MGGGAHGGNRQSRASFRMRNFVRLCPSPLGLTSPHSLICFSPSLFLGRTVFIPFYLGLDFSHYKQPLPHSDFYVFDALDDFSVQVLRQSKALDRNTFFWAFEWELD